MASSTPVDESIPSADAVTNQNEVKEITRDYLKRSIIPSDDSQLVKAYQLCDKLYRDILDTVSGFVNATGDDSQVAEKLSAVSADLAGTTYMHTALEHQRYIAIYTACIVYADDIGSRHIDALAQFSRRFVTGEKQLSPGLEVLAGLLKQSYDLWPEVGADCIVYSTLAGMTSMHLEFTMDNMVVTPKATRWPNYFRDKTGFASAYAHFNFAKGWRSTPDSYMQLSPYMEFFINSCNDLLSFYKEELSGETTNYVHIRATTDEMTPVDTLRVLAEETLASEERIGLLIGEDRELMGVWRSFEQGYIAFYMKTPRYRLSDLTL